MTEIADFAKYGRNHTFNKYIYIKYRTYASHHEKCKMASRAEGIHHCSIWVKTIYKEKCY